MHPAHRTISSRLQIAVVAGLAATVALYGPASARDSIQPGTEAPGFTVQDSTGKPVELSSFKGRTVVLEWSNHDCPYVMKHYGTGAMQQLQKDAAAGGAVWLTVLSSAPGRQGYVAGLEADKLSSDRKAQPTRVLLDSDGKVGRLYGASTTPHMFVVDPAGKIAYMGAIDDKPSTNPATIAGARSYVREALAAVTAGKPVAVASTRPYGCSVKYSSPRS